MVILLQKNVVIWVVYDVTYLAITPRDKAAQRSYLVIDFELTDLLIELEDIQQQKFLNLARGQQVTDLLDFYEMPQNLYTLKQEPANGRPPEQCRRKIACFNFGLVNDDIKTKFIECLYLIGHTPEFISEGLGEDIRFVAESLRQVVDEARTLRASALRKNPQRFRLVAASE
ncbi:MAG: hypothetical protein COA99_03620 [Moraxellaceae bacterium]|nr:MAG: hypothetical protein COA99_03620 [Moraxellaceae bacterium]